MGQEAVLFGCIVGATWRPGPDYRRLQAANVVAVEALPQADHWPFLVRGIFALPGEFPEGTFRSQVIHFGASQKDDPSERELWNTWIVKFENLLRGMYWTSACATVETDFWQRTYVWKPSSAALAAMKGDPPSTIQDWQREVQTGRG